jgi:hypothetical protein
LLYRVYGLLNHPSATKRLGAYLAVKPLASVLKPLASVSRIRPAQPPQCHQATRGLRGGEAVGLRIEAVGLRIEAERPQPRGDR